jgi:capsular polysaccharide biosynthesis protein
MQQCKLLIGVHGAGLTNMMFMQKGNKVLELRKRDDKYNNCYFGLASACELDYYYLSCDVDNRQAKTQETNFIVNPFHFKNTVIDILKNI